MPNVIDKQVIKLLKLQQINVSASYLTDRLRRHAHYPSALSVTATLDELGIENVVLKVDEKTFAEVPCPFLAHLSSNGGEFILVKSHADLKNTTPDFFERWDGIILAVEAPLNWTQRENSERLKEDRKSYFNQLLFVALLCCLSTSAIFFEFSWVGIILLLIAQLGVFITWHIVGKELGIQSDISDQICGEKSGCGTTEIRLFGLIGFGDAGIIWFTSLLLLIIISSLSKTSLDTFNTLTPIATAILPFIPFSIYHQWKIKKQWCRLCILTLLLLLIQFGALAGNYFQNPLSFPKGNQIFLTFCMLTLVTLAWKMIKSLIIEKIEDEDHKYRGFRLRFQEGIFDYLLSQSSKVDTVHWEHELQIGNRESQLQFVVCCSPYCPPCAKAHHVFHDLLDRYDFGLSVRFSFNVANPDSLATKSVKYILQVIKENENNSSVYKRKILDDWFSMVDLDKFAKKYPVSADVEVYEQMEKHGQWSNQAKIKFTPTVFINGRQMPGQYRIDELRYIIADLIANEELSDRRNVAG